MHPPSHTVDAATVAKSAALWHNFYWVVTCKRVHMKLQWVPGSLELSTNREFNDGCRLTQLVTTIPQMLTAHQYCPKWQLGGGNMHL